MANSKRKVKFLLHDDSGVLLEALCNQLKNYFFEEITGVYTWDNILNDLDFDRINSSIPAKGFDSLALYLNQVREGPCFYHGIPSITKEALIEHIKKTNDELNAADLFLILLHDKEEKRGTTIKDSVIYKKACINRDVYSRFINMRFNKYQPSRTTMICLALALELPTIQFQKFMNTAGYYMRNNNKPERVIMYCVENSFYDVLQINKWICELYGENNALVKPPREEKVKLNTKKPQTQEQQLAAFCVNNGIDVLHTAEGDKIECKGKLVNINVDKRKTKNTRTT